MLLLEFLAALASPGLAWCSSPADKPPISPDEFYSLVEIHGLALAPDGNTAVIRVAAEEGYLFERALETEKTTHQFMVFPGEGHRLASNPWPGYIKVRDELLWLDKYDHASQ